MAALFFYLSRDRERYGKLAHEIRSSFSSGKDINASTLADFRYLRACIDEALRLAPPAPGVLWRERGSGDDSQEPLLVDGVPIPRGTMVGLSLYTLHHDEQYFPDPFAFCPERWLQPATSEQAKLAKDAFAPFSVGSRACGGKSMAYTEINLIIAKTLWYFDFEPASGDLGKIGSGGLGLGLGRERPGEFQIYDVFNALHDGPYLNFKPRADLYKDLIDA
jgi:cytochrome P450